MRKILSLKRKAYIISSASVGGREEREGPLGELFDFTDTTDRFGKDTWEKAEGEMGRISLSLAMKKANISPSDIDVLFAGDLENQCVASSGGLYSFGIPYVGLYSACSTCTEGLLLLSSLISEGSIDVGATVTTSHNSAAERQFRTPIEYGAQRTPTSQWTATAAGSFILSAEKRSNVYIDNALVGKIVDGLTPDGSNMGMAMARAAFDSVYTYLSLNEEKYDSLNAIFTGDLGRLGSEIFSELIYKHFPRAADIHRDCGTLLYDMNKRNCNAGASGCGCSASVLSSYVLPRLESGDLSDILFISTGALMSPGSVQQGENILGIAPVVNIKREKKI